MLLFVSMLTSCSKDEPDANREEFDNIEYLHQLTRGEVSTSYNLISTQIFSRYITFENGKEVWGKWKEWDLSQGIMGLRLPAPDKITFHEGRSWSPFEWLDLTNGFHKLYFPLVAYRKKTGFSKEFYTAYKLDYNAESNELNLEGKTFTKEFLNENSFKITYNDLGWYTNKDGEIYAGDEKKYIMQYQKCELHLPDLENILFYDNEYECCMAILKMLRDEFGDEVDVNKYTSSWMVMDYPIYNFDEIEEYLHEKYNR